MERKTFSGDEFAYLTEDWIEDNELNFPDKDDWEIAPEGFRIIEVDLDHAYFVEEHVFTHIPSNTFWAVDVSYSDAAGYEDPMELRQVFPIPSVRYITREIEINRQSNDTTSTIS